MKKDLKEVPKKMVEPLPLKEEKVAEEVKTDEYNIEIIRDYYGAVDPFYLEKKDPNYAYRFLRDEQKNISIKSSNLLLLKGGWQIVPKEHLFRLGIKPKELSPDGLLRRGDTILAFMPKKLYEEKLVKKQLDANRPVKDVRKVLTKGDQTIGGKDTHETMQGIQTKQQLGIK